MRLSKQNLLNFVLLSSNVLTGKQWLCLKRFLPTPFCLTGLYLVVARHHRLVHDYWAAISSLRSPGLEAYTCLEPMMRSGLKTGNPFLLATYEVTGNLYKCSGIWPFLWIGRSTEDAQKEKYTASRSCAKSLPFHFRIVLGQNVNKNPSYSPHPHHPPPRFLPYL